MKQEDLDQLANARSFSLTSVTASAGSPVLSAASGIPIPESLPSSAPESESDDDDDDDDDEEEEEEEETPVNTLERGCVPPTASGKHPLNLIQLT